MIYNLWFNNDGSPELDFNTDPEVNNLCDSIFFFLNVVKVVYISLRWFLVLGCCRIFELVAIQKKLMLDLDGKKSMNGTLLTVSIILSV